MRWQKGEYSVSDQREELNLEVIHDFLRESYWAKGIPREIVAKTLDHSLCFGLFRHHQQIGFGRTVTDRATFAYLSDVFILPDHRGQGLARWLVSCIRSHPELQGLRRWLLATADAHRLYKEHGFAPLRRPEWFLEIHDPEIYLRET
jgi:ribosomal protein S18 acetylase RimI-like enzyme